MAASSEPSPVPLSAEHGLGVLKTDEARRYKDPVQIEAMRAVRRALDSLSDTGAEAGA